MTAGSRSGRPVRAPRGRLALLSTVMVVVCVAVPVGASGPAAQGATSTCAGVEQVGAWSWITLPQGSANPNPSVAVDPVDPNVIWAASGTTVQRSLDGGCSWHQVFDVSSNVTAENAPLLASPSIVAISTARAGTTRETYLLLSSSTSGLGSSLYVASTADGRSWQIHLVQAPATTGATATPAVANDELIAVAPSAPRTAYVVMSYGGAAGCYYINGTNLPPPANQTQASCLGRNPAAGIYVTSDAGSSWTLEPATGLPQWYFAALSGSPQNWHSGLVVEPGHPNVLLATYQVYANSSTVFAARSTDGGRTFKPAAQTSVSTQDDFDPPYGSFSSLTSNRAEMHTNAAFLLSSDAGAHFGSVIRPPGVAHTAGHVESVLDVGGGRQVVLAGYGPAVFDFSPYLIVQPWLYSDAHRTWTALQPPVRPSRLGFVSPIGVWNTGRGGPLLAWEVQLGYAAGPMTLMEYRLGLSPRRPATVWQQASGPAPPTRGGAATTYDAATGQVVMFGGYSPSGSGYLGDTWLWTGQRWTNATGSGPSPRTYPFMVYDSAARRVLLFGGDGRSKMLNDSWTWNGRSWSKLAGPMPSPRDSASGLIAYDDAHKQVVLFGGTGDSSNPSASSETWVWNGKSWTQATGPGPSARTDAAMVYDTASKQLVLFGGSTSAGDSGETWIWNGVSWAPGPSGPAPRTGASMSYDAATRQVVLFGGAGAAGFLHDTWTWNGSAWSQHTGIAPSARAHSFTVYDSIARRVILFGGSDDSGYTGGFDDTWSWDGKSWRELRGYGPTVRSTENEAGAVVADTAHHQLVLIGGFAVWWSYLADTWTRAG